MSQDNNKPISESNDKDQILGFNIFVVIPARNGFRFLVEFQILHRNYDSV